MGTFGSGGSYYDVNVSGPDASNPGAAIKITLNAGGNTGNLYYLDGNVWKPVVARSNGATALSEVAPTGANYIFELNNTDTQPLVSQLTGTAFTGASAEIRLDPNVTTLAEGETLVVEVEATSLGVYGVDVSVDFNATKLAVTNITLGNGLAADVVAVNSKGSGTLRFAYAQKADLHPNPVLGTSSTPILLATITFEALAAGASPTYLVSDALWISSALFSDKNGIDTTPGILDDTSNKVELTINPSPAVSVDIALQGRTSVAGSGILLEMKPTGLGSVLYSPAVAAQLSIANVPAKEYDVRVDAPKYLAAIQTVTIPADAVSWDLNGTVKDVASGMTLTLRGGDLNDDDKINIQDLVLIGANFGSTVDSADINDDGVVNIQDLAIAAGNFGAVTNNSTTYTNPW